MSEMGGLEEQLEPMLHKARRSLNAAQQHLEAGDWDFVSSRAYYAAFYAMEAILLTRGLSFSKHAGVISAFNQHFVKEGIFPQEFGRLISRLFRQRQTGDYDFDLSIEPQEAVEDIQSATEVVEAIRRHLQEKRFIRRSE